MGNGASCYKKTTADRGAGKENDSWRVPKQKNKSSGSATKQVPAQSSNDTWRKPKGEEKKPTPTTAPISNGQSVAKAKAQAHAAEKIATSWHVPEPSTILQMGKSVPPISKDDEDDDFSGFENLLGAAEKVWEDLMAQKHETRKDFTKLFQLGELKDGVERAAKRVEHLQRELNMANAKVDAKKAAIDHLCSQIKSNTNSENSVAWKLGDIAIRRGKGLCEICMVHHEAQPPYFEVRMACTGDVVGTESVKLVPLMPADVNAARKAMHELDDSRKYAVQMQEETNLAQEDLKQQHLGLTGQMEEALNESQKLSPDGRPSSKNGLPPGMPPLPPGMPELDVRRKLSTSPREQTPNVSPVAQKPASTYPDMKGVKEDMRGNIQREVSPSSENAQQQPVHGNVQPQRSKRENSQPGGFPSLDELNKMSQQAHQAPKVGVNYPSVHPGAARETFQRPTTQVDKPQQEGNTRLGSKGPASRGPSVPNGFPAFGPNSGGPSIPSGFPTFDKFESSGKQASSTEPPPFRAGGLGSHAEKSRVEAQAAQAAAAEARARAEAQARAEAEAEAKAKAKEEKKKQATQQQEHNSVPEWVCYQTTEGVPYYHNERTKETVWVLPSGAAARYPNGQPATPARKNSFHTNDWFQAEQSPEDDPFTDLRKQEEAMRQQREYWSQWYSQYSAWYQQQAGQHASESAPKKDLPKNGAETGSSSESKTKLPPKGPSPPKLDASIEDRAMYAIKSAVLKEMEQMVDQGVPTAQRKKALRCLQVRWHPDKNPEKVEVANSVFQFIEETKPWFLHDQDGQDAT